MTKTVEVTAPAKNLNPKALRLLAAQTGPCLTVAVPEYRPGAPEQTQRAVLKSLLQQAAKDLAGGDLADQGPALLAPLEELAESKTFEAGGNGWAIFRAPEFWACHRAPVTKAQWSLGRQFLLTPFVADAFAPEEFLVLVLNTKKLRLLEYAGGQLGELPWPDNIPSSLEAAGQFDRPGREQLNRSPGGVLGGTQFGTGTERETTIAHLHDFFETVDRGLRPIMGERPLVLLGVQEEITAYRRATKLNGAVIPGPPGNVEFLTLTEIGKRAHAAVLEDYEHAAFAVLTKIREMRDRSRVATEVGEILAKAAEGRVHQLCVRADSELTVPTPRATGLTDADGPVNTAIVETLRHGGDVFVLSGERIPELQPMAAILRY